MSSAAASPTLLHNNTSNYVSSSSPIRKIIFIQRAAKFACRTVEDILTINSVCTDFEETIKDHDTFCIIFFRHIVQRYLSAERDAFFTHFFRKLAFISCKMSSVHWITLQATTVNQNDETQRGILKQLLLGQAKEEHNLLFSNASDDPMFIFIFEHILDQYAFLGISKMALETKHCKWNVLTAAAATKNLPSACLRHLLKHCYDHKVDCRKLLLETTDSGMSFIMSGCAKGISRENLQILIDFIISVSSSSNSEKASSSNTSHSMMSQILEMRTTTGNRNTIMIAASSNLNVDAFELLLQATLKYSSTQTIKKMLESVDTDGANSVVLACRFRLNPESLTLLLKFCCEHSDVNILMNCADAEKRNFLLSAIGGKLSFDSMKTLLKHFIHHKSADAHFVKKALEARNSTGRNSIMIAASCNAPVPILKLLLRWSNTHASLKSVLEAQDNSFNNVLMTACLNRASTTFLSTLLRSCSRHVSVKPLFTSSNKSGWNVMMIAIASCLPTDSIRVLLSYCEQYCDMSEILMEGLSRNLILLGARYNLEIDSMGLLIQSCSSETVYQSLISVTDEDGRTARELAMNKNKDVHDLLSDQDAWKKCVAWYKNLSPAKSQNNENDGE